MKVKALVIFCVLLAALTLSLMPAHAGDGYEKYIEWYSDATKTEVVGWRQQNCGGFWESEGYQTAYREQWIGAECVEGGGSGGGTVCYYQNGFICPAYCSYCISH
jgi:hypothetical protein